MSITKEQQQALDNALVPREQRLTIGSCNYRLSTTFKPKEPTFQVALDVLSLTPFYPAFLITASVPAVYMHEFWATASYHKHSIRFKLNTKSYSFDLDTFRNMLQMCPKLPGQKFVDPPFEEEILTFIRELGYSGNIKLLSDVKVEILPQPWRTFETIINKCLSGKAMKASEAYKTYYAFATGKAIPKPKYIHQSTKEKPEQAPKASSVKRLKAIAKMKLAIERSKTQLHSSQPSGSGAHEGTGVTPGVLDVPIYRSDEEKISWKSSDEEDDDDEARKDDEVNKEESNDESNEESNEESDEEVQGAKTKEEEMDEEATHEEDEVNELYRDVNVNLEGRDTVMMDAPLPNV
ncbi:hypothetical protein Tco_1127634 [Tanacetum coccineum]